MIDLWLNQIEKLSLWQVWFLIGLNVFLIAMLVVENLKNGA